MALLSIFRGTQAECSARPVSDGTLLFATDTKKIYLDKDSSRIEMSSVDDLSDYVTKEQLTTALNGKANTTHTHTQDQVIGLKDALAGKASTSHSHPVASSSASGFMSAADKQKLDGIAAGANKYTLPVASSTALGGVKIGYKESGRNYSVKLDDNNQAYVTVPWTDTTSKDTNTTYTLTKSGSTITLEGSDGSSTAVNDDNTTYSLSSFGVNASAAELNYVKGVTSSIQTQLDSKAASNHTHSNYLTTTGTAAAATKLATARYIRIVGDSSGFAPFDGTSNISIQTAVLQHWTTPIPANDDLNSYTDPGWYMCNSNNDVATLSNRPSDNAFTMVVLKSASITQIVFEYMTSGYKIYTRNKYDYTWGSWGRVYTTENKPTYSEIGAAAANHSHSNYLTTSGTAAAANKLATARTISLAGDVTGSANFDGSANISITSNIAAGTVGTNELASNAVTNAKIAADSVSLAKLGSDVGTVAVQSAQPSDTNVKLWIQPSDTNVQLWIRI